MVQDLGRRANASMEKYYQQEQTIMDSRIHLNQGSPSWYLAASHEMSPASQNLSKRALRMETMALMLVELLKMTPEDAVSLLPSVGIYFIHQAVFYFLPENFNHVFLRIKQNVKIFRAVIPMSCSKRVSYNFMEILQKQIYFI